MSGRSPQAVKILKGWFSDEVIVWRTIATAMIVTVVGGAWDVWWHTMVGRESFFEPPHIMIYAGVMIACAVGFFAWWLRREKVWKHIAFALLAIPLLVAPFDELWHRIFGFEDLTSVWIIWSPPHVALDLSLALVLVLLLPFVKREREELKILFGTAIFATLATLFSFLVIPLDPEGQFHLLGWWGTIGSSFVVTAVILYGARFLGGILSALSIAIWLAVYIAIDAEVGVKSDTILMLPYFEFPTWLLVFASFVLAAAIDISKSVAIPIRGALAGLAWGVVLYGVGVFFIPQEFVYGGFEIGVAVFAAALGGLLGGLLVSRLPLAIR